MVQNRFVRPLLARGFVIPAQGACGRECGLHFGLTPLRPSSILADARALAARALPGHVALVTAVMAGERTLRGVVGQRNLAARAFQRLPAVAAGGVSSCAAPV